MSTCEEPANPTQAEASEDTRQAYLTECIYELGLGSHLPHKIVNLLFTITN